MMVFPLKDQHYFRISSITFSRWITSCFFRCSYWHYIITSFVLIVSTWLMVVPVQCHFIKSIWPTPLTLSVITFLWKCLYHCDIFLLHFVSTVLGLKHYMLYPPRYSSQICIALLACLFWEEISIRSFLALSGDKCVCVCASLPVSFVHHIHRFVLG